MKMKDLATYHGCSGLPLEMQSGGPSESTASAMTSYNIITVHQARFSELSKRKQHSSLRRGLALAGLEGVQGDSPVSSVSLFSCLHAPCGAETGQSTGRLL